MNWAIKIISKALMTKILHISWGGYDKGFYGTNVSDILKILKGLWLLKVHIQKCLKLEINYDPIQLNKILKYVFCKKIHNKI